MDGGIAQIIQKALGDEILQTTSTAIEMMNVQKRQNQESPTQRRAEAAISEI